MEDREKKSTIKLMIWIGILLAWPMFGFWIALALGVIYLFCLFPKTVKHIFDKGVEEATDAITDITSSIDDDD